jgi:putative acetyltransferase
MEFYVRPVEPSDARGLNALRRMPGVFENILGVPSERVKLSEDFLINLDKSIHMFVAVKKDMDSNGEVIGCASLNVHTNPRTRHVGDFAIMVHSEYHSQGVGTALVAAIIDIADNWLMLERVNLEVYPDNEKAIGLYKKFGFKLEGRKINAVIRNGEYIDECIMGRIRNEAGKA